jgi:hypothetical protein
VQGFPFAERRVFKGEFAFIEADGRFDVLTSGINETDLPGILRGAKRLMISFGIDGDGDDARPAAAMMVCIPQKTMFPRVLAACRLLGGCSCSNSLVKR